MTGCDCADPSQCWEPCGELGKSMKHARLGCGEPIVVKDNAFICIRCRARVISPDIAYFHDEDAAFAFIEACIWPKGAKCPRCGHTDRVDKLRGKYAKGTYKCYRCRRSFTVRIGTIFQDSRIALRLWLQTIYLVDKGVNSHQIHRAIGITYKSAWFLLNRVRHAIYTGEFASIVNALKRGPRS